MGGEVARGTQANTYNPHMKWTENDVTDIEQNVYEIVSG